jgi:hypothetical protein
LIKEVKVFPVIVEGQETNRVVLTASGYVAAKKKAVIGSKVKNHLTKIQSELVDFDEQSSFIRYEMLNGKKEVLKNKILDKNKITKSPSVVHDRSFYVQNGYEYYPFQGEYWLDEVGNYHYLGKQSCE